MIPKRISAISIAFLLLVSSAWAQEKSASPAKNEAPEPRAKDGKKLLTAQDLLKINGVSAPKWAKRLTNSFVEAN